MKFVIDWKKIKKFFFYTIKWLFQFPEKLVVPIDCYEFEENQKSLVGNAYYFNILKSWKVNSPMRGKVDRIYNDYSLKITNKEGLQILVCIQLDKEKSIPINKIAQCEVWEGKIVDTNTRLFSIYLNKEVTSITIYVPWQPELISKIESNCKNAKKNFAKIYYRNLYFKNNLKNHGLYK